MTDELRREVVVARRRKRRMWIALLVAALIPTQALLMMHVLEPRETVRVVHTTTTDIVSLPIAFPVERMVNVPLDRAACPPPRTDAPFVQPAQLPESIIHVQPSVTNAGWIAAWNAEHVYVSTDAGASWQRRLDGREPVEDVTFDCFGRVLVMRGTKVGIRDGGDEHWHPVPDILPDDPESSNDVTLLGGGPDIVVIAHPDGPKPDFNSARLVVSRDVGDTWEGEEITHYWEGGTTIHGRQHEDGTVLAMIPLPDCDSETAIVFRWKDSALEVIDTQLATDLVFWRDRMVSRLGWQTIGTDTTHALPEFDDHVELIEGPYPIAIVGTAAWRLDGAKAKKLPWKLSDEASEFVADPAGRIWSVQCGQLLVATRSAPGLCPYERDGEI